MENKVESGVQLFQRISSRPNITGLHPIIPNNVHDVSTVIEVSESNCSVKWGFIMELLLRSVLADVHMNGRNCGAILINTEHRFNLMRFVSLLKRTMKRTFKDKNAINEVVESCLNKLTVLNCYSEQQLQMTIFNLENILLENTNIGLIVFDSLSAFYWGEKVGLDDNIVVSVQSYCLKLFSLLYTTVKEFEINFIYGNQRFEDNFAVAKAIKDKKQLENYHKISFYNDKTDLIAEVSNGNKTRVYTCQPGDIFNFTAQNVI